jgi:two-component system sensor histidine kinase MtrB
VAHELRTPVAALVGEASLLKAELDRLGADSSSHTAASGPAGQGDAASGRDASATRAMTPDARRAAELVVGDVARLRRLVDDLLEISRIDAHSAELAWEEVDVEDFLRRMAVARGWPSSVSVGARSAAAVATGPEEESAPGTIILTTDRRRLERIVVNLVDNALRHGAPPVLVETRVALPPPGAQGRPPQLVLTVTDHGPGIPPEHLPHVFERFYKADAGRPAGSGSGLGLAIAWENARLLAGSLRVRSAPGEGTRFVLRLPLARSQEAGVIDG